MGTHVRTHAWAPTPLRRPEHWTQPLKTLVGVMLSSNQPMFVAWGAEHTLIYNDAYADILGNKHPAALGKPFLEVWHEIQADLLPIVEQAYTGRPVQMDDIELIMHRKGFAEETHFSFSYTPVRDEAGAVAGFFCPCIEITAQVLAERRRAFQLSLEERLRDLAEPREVIAAASEALGRYLDVDQVAYAEVEPGEETVVVECEWNTGAMAVNVRRHRLDDYGPAFGADLRGGETIVIPDVRLDPRTSSPDALATFDGSLIKGFLNVPVIKAGRLVAILAVHSARERAWAAEDVALAEETAERLWAAAGRARAEAELRNSETRLRTSLQQAERRAAEMRAILESMPDAVYIGAADGISIANQPALDQLGFSSAEELNRHVATLAEEIQTRDFETGVFIPLEDQAFTRAFRGERVVQDVKVRHRITGEDRIVRCAAAPVLIDGEVIAAVAVNTDVTDRRRTEAALRESEGRFREIADAAPVLIWISDTTKACTWFNHAWLAFTGRTLEEEYGYGWAEGVHPDDFDRCVATYNEAFDNRAPFRMDYRLRRHDGSYRVFDDAGVPRFAEDGAFLGYIGACTDVTEARNAEQAVREANETLEHRVAERTAELEKAQDALRQSQKLEAMGQLTGGVAHDFNNLLTPIIGSLDMLVRRRVGSERERRLIDGALQSAERAKILVQRLLAFARRQPLQPAAVDLRRLVGEMAELVASTSGPNVDVQIALPDDLPPVLADANQIEMAILNLAVNARDAMPDGGVLTLSAKTKADPAGMRPGHYVQLSVADTGVGMDDVTLARAVEPFFSTKGVGKGTGLGLSMVHGLALQLNGTLGITSRPGEGTRVDLLLPISASPAEAVDERREIEPHKGLGQALLVDDEDLVRMSTADMLVDLGYEVIEASSADEALALIAEGLRPDILVTDHLMPGMSGAELAHELRAGRPNLRVLIVTGYAEEQGIEATLPRLTKPFRLTELAEMLIDLGPAPNE